MQNEWAYISKLTIIAYPLAELVESTIRALYPHVLRQPLRNLNLEILCAGLGGEIRGLQSLGFSFDVLGLAEKKGSAHKFLLFNFRDVCKHMKVDNLGLLPEGGKCFSCGADKCPGSATRPVIVSAGFPCPPFTKRRQKTGKPARTGPTVGHPDFDLVMVQFIRYLQVRQLLSFFVEEVLGFLQPLQALDGLNPCQALVNKIHEQTAYRCQAIKVCHSVFIKEHTWAGLAYRSP